MPQASELSVIVPTRGLRPLQRTLSALARLNSPAAEIILVDDGSPRPLDIPASELPVRIVRQSRSGPAAARNLGARSARSPWLVFLDDDCVPEPSWLDEIATHITPATAVAGILRNALTGNVFAQASHILVREFVLSQHLPPNPEYEFLPSANLAVCARSFWHVGGFNERFPGSAGEDREFCYRWRRSGYSLRFASAAIVDHYHDMRLPEFVRQHYRYGQGARLFYSLHHGARTTRKRLYARLARSLFEQEALVRAAALGGLLAVSQASSAVGYLASGARLRAGQRER